MITPGYLLQAGRYNQQQDPLGYDPNNVVDPMQAIAVQQQYAKSLLQYQQQLTNPRLALPQQFGAALGGAVQGALPQSMQAGPQQAPQGPQAGPQTPAAQAIHQKFLELKQSGMDAGEALYTAADAGDDQQYGEQGGKAADQARQWAIKNLKFDPETERKAKIEAKYKGGINYVDPKSGEQVSVQPGSSIEKALMSSGFIRAGEQGSVPMGTVEHQTNMKGLDVYNTMGAGGKSAKTSYGVAPVQVSATLTGDDASAAAAGTHPGLLTNAGHDKSVEELTHRSAATQNAVDALDGLQGLLNQDPNSVGKAGDVTEKFNNLASTVQSLANTASGTTPDKRDYTLTSAQAKKMAGLVDRFRSSGVNATKWNAAITDAAYAIEAAQGDKNTDPASRKSRIDQIKNELLADSSSDAGAIGGVIDMQKNTLLKRLSRDYDNAPQAVSKPTFLKDYETKSAPKPAASNRPQEGQSGKSKSGKDIVFTNGAWHYAR